MFKELNKQKVTKWKTKHDITCSPQWRAHHYLLKRMWLPLPGLNQLLPSTSPLQKHTQMHAHTLKHTSSLTWGPCAANPAGDRWADRGGGVGSLRQDVPGCSKTSTFLSSPSPFFSPVLPHSTPYSWRSLTDGKEIESAYPATKRRPSSCLCRCIDVSQKTFVLPSPVQ